MLPCEIFTGKNNHKQPQQTRSNQKQLIGSNHYHKQPQATKATAAEHLTATAQPLQSHCPGKIQCQ
jgi:hypothetical protein